MREPALLQQDEPHLMRIVSYTAGIVGLALLVGCAHGSAPETPAARWRPPAEAIAPAPRPAPPPPGLTPEELKGRTISLAEAVNVALQNSPLTRQSWFQARAAVADLGSRQSALYPSVELDAFVERQKQSSAGGRLSTLLTSYGPTASLSYLLLDLGGRSADIEEAKQSLFAADFTHNATMNDLILLVAQSYYTYQGARALLVAQEASLKQAEENYAAANERHRAGVATIADVLQAKTSLSQQKLAYETVEGQIETIRGQLTTALGVPISLPVDAAPLPENVHEDEVIRSVDTLMADAERLRPDLAAARSRALAAKSHVKSVRSGGLPTLSASASINRTWFQGADAVTPWGDNYTYGVFFRWPVFEGFRVEYDTKQAEAQAGAAEAEAETAFQRVVYQVWSSYYNLQTAVQQLKASRDLLESARESAEVARGRYKEGVGSILDLLTAESALAVALAQDVRSRAGFLLSLAQLAHDTGTVNLGPAPGGADTKEIP